MTVIFYFAITLPTAIAIAHYASKQSGEVGFVLGGVAVFLCLLVADIAQALK